MDFAYFDIIFFALLAAYILNRLRTTLGEDDGSHVERSSSSKVTRIYDAPKTDEPVQETIADIRESMKKKEEDKEEQKLLEEVPAATKKAIERIKEHNAEFTLPYFIEGAKSAFDMVIEAFDEGDRDTLKNLLNKDVFKEFDTIITEREENDYSQETTIIAVSDVSPVSASLRSNVAKISLKFQSEQISVIKDSKGKVVDGDPSVVEVVEDIWTFERDVTSSDPNWTITSIDD